MKIALITDQHFGVRDSNQHLIDHFRNFYENVFFPIIDERQIDHIIDLGDTFDVRKYVTTKSLYDAKEMWFNPIRDRKIALHSIVGNHTAYYRNTNSINTMSAAFKSRSLNGITIYDSPENIFIDGTEIALIPWINTGNYDEVLDFIETTTARIAMGHFEFKGFEMYRGDGGAKKGMNPGMVSKFDIVYSGHFHHKSKQGNIQYLGSPYDMIWSDYDDFRGFHIFDTETLEIEPIENPYKIHIKYEYDDSKFSNVDSLMRSIPFENFTNKYVKLIVNNKQNPQWFETTVKKIEEYSCIDLQIIDKIYDDQQFDDEYDVDLDDTPSLISKYIDTLSDEIDKKELDFLMKRLYNEAIQLEK